MCARLNSPIASLSWSCVLLYTDRSSPHGLVDFLSKMKNGMAINHTESCVLICNEAKELQCTCTGFQRLVATRGRVILTFFVAFVIF